VTLIAAINAMGWAVAPYLIFKAKNRDASWYPDLKPQWRIGVSDNGWTTNDIGVAWLRHFVKQIQGRRVGSHVLLTIDGHESHKSLAFQNLCEDNKIITLCMPPHSSHILQPLDVAYSKEIRVTEHQLFQVSERSISIDYSFKHDSNAFVNLFSNVLPLLQALWRARCPVLSFTSLLS
jgi:hypothetical protein